MTPRPIALISYSYSILARTIWATVQSGRRHAREGDIKRAHDTCYALLQLEPKDFPPRIVKLIQDGVDDIYRLTDTALPLKMQLKSSLAQTE